MDLSKLPKLSRTSENQAPPSSQPLSSEHTPQVPDAELAPVGQPPIARPPRDYFTGGGSIGLAEAWISIALGIFVLFIFPSTIRYVHSPAAFEQNYPVTDEQGNTIPYPKSVIFWTDLGVTVFAVALILEGLALAAARKVGPLWVAFVVTVLAAIFNVIVIAHAFPINGFQPFCGIGVVVLGYMALTQWRLISFLRAAQGSFRH
jgi:hypothetical protein